MINSQTKLKAFEWLASQYPEDSEMQELCQEIVELDLVDIKDSDKGEALND
jgi:hypothetical protein